MALAHVRRGSGPPLVLIHGIGSQWQMWRPVLDRVSREREVVAVDLPGFGDSAALPRPPDGRGARRRGRGVPRRPRAGRRARGRQLARRRASRWRWRGRARRARPACSPPPASGTCARAATRAPCWCASRRTAQRARRARRGRRRADRRGARSPSATSSRGRGASRPTRRPARCATSRARPASTRRWRRSSDHAFGGPPPELPGHRRLGREGPAADLLAPERACPATAARRAPRDARRLRPRPDLGRPGAGRARAARRVGALDGARRSRRRPGPAPA